MSFAVSVDLDFTSSSPPARAAFTLRITSCQAIIGVAFSPFANACNVGVSGRADFRLKG
ncbi:hypothetical protein [Novosphingobium album (ex Hu et al. 2023)]|uniref:Uncharacterized protein n=1 Tax=Novosphingobium album (ex Hu et al. 2023) TaxID=2930093 RepID=A0ABT0B1R0_9SPHN|nr:hypothetical protein [Novosphingobium album (ex Hu et al. 2023)]MCJ2178970.1 hypothetical protein [Novosphingobium album (ex Hu et al. 2023)]